MVQAEAQAVVATVAALELRGLCTAAALAAIFQPLLVFKASASSHTRSLRFLRPL
jgi:hypothetical protein